MLHMLAAIKDTAKGWNAFRFCEAQPIWRKAFAEAHGYAPIRDIGSSGSTHRSEHNDSKMHGPDLLLSHAKAEPARDAWRVQKEIWPAEKTSLPKISASSLLG